MQSAASQEDSARKPLMLRHDRRFFTRHNDEDAALRLARRGLSFTDAL
jgi:hypothetical protein